MNGIKGLLGFETPLGRVASPYAAPEPMVIVVEGADGTGKTTFAETMRDLYGAVVVHNGVPPHSQSAADLATEYLDQIGMAIHRRDVEGVSTVIDRSFLGELVYGRHRPQGSRFTRGTVRHLERYCRRNNVLMLGIEAPLDTRRSRILQRGEEWLALYAYTGAEYGEYFRGRGKRFWVTAESNSAITTK